jgi:hypothetical protein
MQNRHNGSRECVRTKINTKVYTGAGLLRWLLQYFVDSTPRALKSYGSDRARAIGSNKIPALRLGPRQRTTSWNALAELNRSLGAPAIPSKVNAGVGLNPLRLLSNKWNNWERPAIPSPALQDGLKEVSIITPTFTDHGDGRKERCCHVIPRTFRSIKRHSPEAAARRRRIMSDSCGCLVKC